MVNDESEFNFEENNKTYLYHTTTQQDRKIHDRTRLDNTSSSKYHMTSTRRERFINESDRSLKTGYK